MANESNSLGLVEVKNFSTRNFRLQNGEVLPELQLAYETYGALEASGRNAILITHGYTSSQHAGRTRCEWRGRMVGRPRRTGQGDRHQQIFRGVIEHARIVVRFHRTREHRSENRRAIWSGFSGLHFGGHRYRAACDARRVRSQASGRGRG